MNKPRVEIIYCTQCGFLLRATWMAQEILTTFADEVGEIALIPGRGGVFEIRVDDEVLYARRTSDSFADAKQIKQLLRDRIAPDKKIGHSE
ncbi:MAG: SelT/SelW/SelH family protein [Acidiferrobacterales bacterium]